MSSIDFPAEEKKKVVDYLKTGHDCSEATFFVGCDMLGITITPELRRIARGIGGGLGSGCICGAVWGGAALINLVVDERKEIKDLNRIFYKSFTEEFGSSCCTNLNPVLAANSQANTDEFPVEQQRKCTKYVLWSTAFATKLLEGKG